jgi:hypothetical protein
MQGSEFSSVKGSTFSLGREAPLLNRPSEDGRLLRKDQRKASNQRMLAVLSAMHSLMTAATGHHSKI